MADILIGTSGWHYASWKGPFYPHELKLKDRLSFYASQFRTAELNSVFYRTPSIAAVKAWREQTPASFMFAWKASKFITHWKRLSARSQNSLDLLEDRLSLLGDGAGPVLFQLPPQFELNYDRLASFIRSLQPNRRYAFEFRHRSWYASRVLRLLSDENIVLCLSDHANALRLGNALRTLSISEATDRADGTKAIIRERRSEARGQPERRSFAADDQPAVPRQ